MRVFRLEAKTGKASDLIELSTRQNFVLWLPGGELLRGWARSASGDTAEGISRIEELFSAVSSEDQELKDGWTGPKAPKEPKYPANV